MIPDIVITPAVAGIVGVLVSAIIYLFKLYLDGQTKGHERELKALEAARVREVELTDERRKAEVGAVEEQRDNYIKMVARLTWAMEAKVNQDRALKGLQPFDVVEPVVPEHNSPTTPEQQATADFATAQARVVAGALAMGIDLKDAPEAIVLVPFATEPDIVVARADVVITDATVTGEMDGEKKVLSGATIIGHVALPQTEAA